MFMALDECNVMPNVDRDNATMLIYVNRDGRVKVPWNVYVNAQRKKKKQKHQNQSHSEHMSHLWIEAYQQLDYWQMLSVWTE